MDGLKGATKVEQFAFVEVGALQTKPGNALPNIKEKLQGEIVRLFLDAPKLLHLPKLTVDFVGVVRGTQLVDTLLTQRREASFTKQMSYFSKPNFCLEIFRIGHHGALYTLALLKTDCKITKKNRKFQSHLKNKL